jgi:hypothetical protein
MIECRPAPRHSRELSPVNNIFRRDQLRKASCLGHVPDIKKGDQFIFTSPGVAAHILAKGLVVRSRASSMEKSYLDLSLIALVARAVEPNFVIRRPLAIDANISLPEMGTASDLGASLLLLSCSLLCCRKVRVDARGSCRPMSRSVNRDGEASPCSGCPFSDIMLYCLHLAWG